VKPEKFRKRKARYEKRAQRQVTDEEFEKLLGRQRKIGLIVTPLCLAAGLAMAVEWPGRWLEPFGQFSSYLGWVVVVLGVVSLVGDILKREGTFYRLDRKDEVGTR
jgi:hypothetical protein